MNSFKSRLSNFWYYYKIPIIIIIAVLFVTADVIISNRNSIKYDNSIAIISKDNYPSEDEVKKIKDIFQEKYGGTFDIIIYNIDLTETGQDEVMVSKLSLDLGNKISKFLFIENMDKFNIATNNLQINVEGKGKNFDWLEGCGVDNLWYATR